MTDYSIQAPDGKTYSITGPPGATRDQIIAKIKERLQAQPEPGVEEDPVTERGTFLPLAERKSGKIEAAVPEFIRAPYKGAEHVVEETGAKLGEMQETDPSEAARSGAGLEAAVEFAPGIGTATKFTDPTRQGIKRSVDAALRTRGVGMGGAYPTGLEARRGIFRGGGWTDVDGNILPRYRETPNEVMRREVRSDADKIGVQLPFAATEGRAIGGVAGGLTATPLGTPIINRSATAVEQLGDRVNEQAGRLGRANPRYAGEELRGGVMNWIDNVRQADNNVAYANLERMIDPNFTADIARTQIMARDILARDMASATDNGRRALRPIEDALNMGTTAGFTYAGLKELRTRVGERVYGDIAPESGVSARAYDGLYRALTEDLRHLVGNAALGRGGRARAEAAFDDATRIAREGFERRDRLTRLIGSSRDARVDPENIIDRVIGMAGVRGRAAIGRLEEVQRSVPRDTWNEVASAVLRRLGAADTKDGFSIAKWRTGYHNLSEEGKTLLFGSGPGSTRETLDRINTVGQRAEQLMKWGNPSGTTRGAVTSGAVFAAFMHPFAVAATAVGDYTLSVMLARPVSAKNTANWMERWLDWSMHPNQSNTLMLQQATRLWAAETATWDQNSANRITQLSPYLGGKQSPMALPANRKNLVPGGFYMNDRGVIMQFDGKKFSPAT